MMRCGLFLVLATYIEPSITFGLSPTSVSFRRKLKSKESSLSRWQSSSCHQYNQESLIRRKASFSESIETFLENQQPSGVTREYVESMIKERGLRENFVVVVTGALGGIGSALCDAIIATGGLVVAMDYQQDGLLALRSKYPGRIKIVVADFQDMSSVSQAADLIQGQVSQIDVVVCNAGIAYMFGNEDVEQAGGSKQGYDQLFQINYLSHYLLVKKLLAKMDKTRGRVVHITSGFHMMADGSGLKSPSLNNLNEDCNDIDSVRELGPAAGRSGDDRLPNHVSLAYANSKLAQLWHAATLNRLGLIEATCACPSWAATGIAGSDEETTQVLAKFAFSTLPKEDEVAGPALRSILNAIFLPSADLQAAGVLDGSRMLGNSRVFDTVFPQNNDRPNLVMNSLTQLFGRENWVGAFASYLVLVLQRWGHNDKEGDLPIFQKTSYECRMDLTGQKQLYEWSQLAVAPFSTETTVPASNRLESEETTATEEDEDLESDGDLIVSVA